jgi:hypothetical protein
MEGLGRGREPTKKQKVSYLGVRVGEGSGVWAAFNSNDPHEEQKHTRTP